MEKGWIMFIGYILIALCCVLNMAGMIDDNKQTMRIALISCLIVMTSEVLVYFYL